MITLPSTVALVQAIFIIEGGHHTRHPFGIKSIVTSNPQAVAIRTVENAKREYVVYFKFHPRMEFTDYLALRWCPPEADPVGHQNWKRNIKAVLAVGGHRPPLQPKRP